MFYIANQEKAQARPDNRQGLCYG